MFQIKNRLVDVKTNFKSKYKENLKCRLCDYPEESQSHLVECEEIISNDLIRKPLTNYTYDDIFS